MIPPAFDYAAPTTVQEAVDLLHGAGDGVKILAGGQSLIPLMKLRLAAPSLLVDINRVKGLDYIKEVEGGLRIGALTRIAAVEASDLIRRKHGIIHDASSVIGDPQVRNLGTIGGNISHGDPTNDMPAVMLALGAEFVATAKSHTRTIKAGGFFLGTFSVGLEPGEMLTEVRVPRFPVRSGGAYLKLEQKAADFATAGAAVHVSIDEKGTCLRAGIGLTAVGPTATNAQKAASYLTGKRIAGPEVVRETASRAAEAADPVTDVRGTADYKRQVVRVLVAEATRVAVSRARGSV